MNLEIKNCIVIPFFNEEKNLVLQDFQNFLSHNHDYFICFVDDGSNDNSKTIINNLMNDHPKQVNIITQNINSGKAEAVRIGVNYCNKNYSFMTIGFLDADLSTSLDEYKRVRNKINGEIEYCFASRIRRIGSKIDAKTHRVIIGKVLRLIINKILQLNAYDTQCGCKIFTKQLSEKIFISKFISKWLFDVEIISRIIHIYGKKIAINKMLEVPILNWVDKNNSNVKFTYMFMLWIDLIFIYINHRKNLT